MPSGVNTIASSHSAEARPLSFPTAQTAEPLENQGFCLPGTSVLVTSSVSLFLRHAQITGCSDSFLSVSFTPRHTHTGARRSACRPRRPRAAETQPGAEGGVWQDFLN